MKKWFETALSLIFNKKIVIMLLLGFACGLPLSLTASTLSAWLTESGVDKSSIGLFALIGVPYSMKFLWAPFLDYFKVPVLSDKLGRRRGWLLITQIALMFSIYMLANVDPTVNLLHVAVIALSVSFLSATQDILVDAYRIEYLSKEEQGMGTSFYVYGYRIGMLLSGGFAIGMAENLDWFLVYSIMSGFSIIGILTTLFGEEKEYKIEQRASYLDILKNTIIGPFLDFCKKPGWLVLLLLVVFYKFSDASVGVMTVNFLMEKGYSKLEIGTWVKTMAVPAVMIGTFIAGVISYRVSVTKSLLIGAIFQTLSNAGFLLVDIFPKSTELLAVTMFIESLCAGLSNTMLLVFCSLLCNNPRFTASQFALLSSLTAVGRTMLASPSGFVVQYVGWSNFFILTMLVSIPSFILIAIWHKRYRHIYASDSRS